MDARLGLNSDDARRLAIGTAAVGVLGLVALLAFAAFAAVQSAGIGSFFQVSAFGLATALAMAAVGALVGFLFGVPRSADSPPPPAGGDAVAPRADARVTYRPNTNLEQISDWLTKILVGVGLVQLGSVPSRLTDMATTLGPGFGNSAAAGVFGLTLSMYFATAGFLLGYVWTRLFMPGVLRRAESFDERAVKAATSLGADAAASKAREETFRLTAALLRGAAEKGVDPKEVAHQLELVSQKQLSLEAAARALDVPMPTEQDQDKASDAVDRSIAEIPEALRSAMRADATSHRTILWVDDRPENNTYVRRALEDLGFEVVTSTSTTDALEKLDRGSFDLIISDLGRPEGASAGFDLFEQLKARRLKTPVLFYTRTLDKRSEAERRGAVGLTNNSAELIRLATQGPRGQ